MTYSLLITRQKINDFARDDNDPVIVDWRGDITKYISNAGITFEKKQVSSSMTTFNYKNFKSAATAKDFAETFLIQGVKNTDATVKYFELVDTLVANSGQNFKFYTTIINDDDNSVVEVL